MLDSGSKQTLIGFSGPQNGHSPGPTCSFLNTRKTTVYPRRRGMESGFKEMEVFREEMFSEPLTLDAIFRSSLDLGLEGLAGRRVGRRRRRGFYPAGPHVGQELVGNLGQDVFGEPGHAQDVVPRSVDVVPEWDKLNNVPLGVSSSG